MFELLKVDLFLDNLKLDVLKELNRPCGRHNATNIPINVYSG